MVPVKRSYHHTPWWLRFLTVLRRWISCCWFDTRWKQFKSSSEIFLLTVPRQCFFRGSFMLFLSYLCYAFVRIYLLMPCGHLLGKSWSLGSRLWCLIVKLLLSHWYPGSGAVLDCIDSWSLPSFLLCCLLLPPLWESVIVLYFVVGYFMSVPVFSIILMGMRELVALLCLSSWCLMIVVWPLLAVPWVCLQFVVVVFPDRTHLLFYRVLILHLWNFSLQWEKFALFAFYKPWFVLPYTPDYCTLTQDHVEIKYIFFNFYNSTWLLVNSTFLSIPTKLKICSIAIFLCFVKD